MFKRLAYLTVGAASIITLRRVFGAGRTEPTLATALVAGRVVAPAPRRVTASEIVEIYSRFRDFRTGRWRAPEQPRSARFTQNDFRALYYQLPMAARAAIPAVLDQLHGSDILSPDDLAAVIATVELDLIVNGGTANSDPGCATK